MYIGPEFLIGEVYDGSSNNQSDMVVLYRPTYVAVRKDKSGNGKTRHSTSTKHGKSISPSQNGQDKNENALKRDSGPRKQSDGQMSKPSDAPHRKRTGSNVSSHSHLKVNEIPPRVRSSSTSERKTKATNSNEIIVSADAMLKRRSESPSSLVKMESPTSHIEIEKEKDKEIPVEIEITKSADNDSQSAENDQSKHCESPTCSKNGD